MIAFGSQGQRHQASCKTRWNSTVTVVKQILGRLNTGRAHWSKKVCVSKWPQRTFGEVFKGLGEWGCWWRGGSWPWLAELVSLCQHVAGMLCLWERVHGKAPALTPLLGELAELKPSELDKVKTTQHFWTICPLRSSRHFPNQINFISYWGRTCYHK